MFVSPGEKLGPYEIQDRLGAGGMGEVYRALDTRLSRSVAVKISAERFSERFEREARMIAALNHPNICTLYDVGPNYIVMELVEGPTLADRLAEGPMPLEEALPLARQIAEALQAAHEKGIVHRDLKPVNIKLKPDGTVKVLDFGLATATSTAIAGISTADSPTFTMGTTQVGAILGTAGYMSPEQARGRPVDKRADIWAFGVVLYEMLTAKKLFEADTVSDSLAAVLTREPDLSSVPFQARRLLRSCLEKDPRQRLHDIGDAFLLLDHAPVFPNAGKRLSGWRWVWPAVAAAAVAALLLQWWLRERATPEPLETLRFQISPSGKATSFQNGMFALSPDGQKIVFAAIENGDQRLWIRALDSLEAHPLAGTNWTRPAPMFWSPDSRFVAFESDNKLKKVDLNGSPPETICDLTAGGLIGGSWSRDNVILFGSTAGGSTILRVSASGGTPAPVTAAGRNTVHGYPFFLPDEKHFLYVALTRGNIELFAGSLEVKPEQQNQKPLLTTQSNVTFVPSSDSGKGRILFVRDGTLYAQSFSPRRLALEGEPRAVQAQVGWDTNWLFGMASASEKNLVFRSSVGDDLQLTWLDRNGKFLSTVGEPGNYQVLALSRDGTRVAVSKPDSSRNFDIWLVDLNGGSGTRFTSDPAPDTAPVWSPDGSRVAFLSFRGGAAGFYEKLTNGAGAETELLKPTPGNTITDWSRDGRYLIFSGSGAIWALPMEGERKPIPFLHTRFNELGARLSPDSRWIAFRSRESGREEIYVETFTPAPDAGSATTTGKWMVSRGGGAGMIHWRRDGKELFYLSLDGGVMAVPVSAGPAFHAGTPERLFTAPASFMRSQTPGNLGDVSPDGQRFLLALPKGGDSGQAFTVVTNWEAGLKD